MTIYPHTHTHTWFYRNSLLQKWTWLQLQTIGGGKLCKSILFWPIAGFYGYYNCIMRAHLCLSWVNKCRAGSGIMVDRGICRAPLNHSCCPPPRVYTASVWLTTSDPESLMSDSEKLLSFLVYSAVKTKQTKEVTFGQENNTCSCSLHSGAVKRLWPIYASFLIIIKFYMKHISSNLQTCNDFWKLASTSVNHIVNQGKNRLVYSSLKGVIGCPFSTSWYESLGS